MQSKPSILLLAAAPLLVAAGCSAPRATIREMGFPSFEPVVGAQTPLVRADPHQTRGLDAFDPQTVKEDADHTFAVSFWPLGSVDKVALEVRARPRGGLPLKQLAVAVYAISRKDVPAYAATGALPHPDHPIAQTSVGAESEVEAGGNMVLTLVFPRRAIPPGTERLAIPALAEFADGWIHVRFYHTGIPAPIKTLTPEEAKQKQVRRALGLPPGAGGPAVQGGPAETTPAGAKQPASPKAGGGR